MYAHTRCRSILRKAESHGLLLCDGPVPLDAPEERALAVELLALAAAIRGVEQGLQPHKLCTYLFELATVYSTFFEKCPVIRAETPDKAASRLRLCNLTARTLALGLGLLGIAAPERM
jgi:arginyl-tRNA synthetase